MNYKVRDKVKIKTWEELEKKYGCDSVFVIYMKETFEKNYPDRIVEIIEVEDIWNLRGEKIYKVKGIEGNAGECFLENDDIEGLGYQIIEVQQPIKSRFQILDIRED